MATRGRRACAWLYLQRRICRVRPFSGCQIALCEVLQPQRLLLPHPHQRASVAYLAAAMTESSADILHLPPNDSARHVHSKRPVGQATRGQGPLSALRTLPPLFLPLSLYPSQGISLFRGDIVVGGGCFWMEMARCSAWLLHYERRLPDASCLHEHAHVCACFRWTSDLRCL